MLKSRLAACILIPLPLLAGAVGWRMDGTGKFPDADPPQEWSNRKNIVWKTDLPDWSNASPVISGNRIFICSEPATLICLSKKDGGILWQRHHSHLDLLSPEEARIGESVADSAKKISRTFDQINGKLRQVNKALKKDSANTKLVRQREELIAKRRSIDSVLSPLRKYLPPKAHKVNGYSSPTPTTDGTYVFAVFGTGMAVCYTMNGDRVWMRLVEQPFHTYGHSSSPLLVNGTLVVYIKHVHGIEATTGTQLWSFDPQIKPKEKPRWGSLAHARIGKTDLAITPRGDILRITDGSALARHAAEVEYNSPLLANRMVYFVENGGKAIELPSDAASGNPVKTMWVTKPKKDRYYASPVLHNGLLYAITQKGVLSVIDAETGAVVYERKMVLKRTVYPSVVMAGKFLYVSDDRGTTVIMKPGREYREAGVNSLEPFRSTPVFEGTRMYVRTLKAMYCIGK